MRYSGMGSFDAIAIGGGLAGAAFGFELARHGLRTAIVERARGPHQKVCGDFHSHEGQELAKSLRLNLGRLGASRITTFRLVSGERAADAPLPFTGAGLSRSSLDEALLASAEDAGAEVLRGQAVSGFESTGDGVSVRIGSRVLDARVAALATGKHNMRGWQRSKGKLAAFKIQLDPTVAGRALLDGVVQLVGISGGYAGACVVEGGVVSLCWLADPGLMHETGGDWRRQIAMISSRSPLFGDLIAGGRFLAEEPVATAAIPFGYMRTSTIADNVYPVGDQLAVIPSLTGDGTSLALLSGIRAAHAVLAQRPASAFQRDHLARLRSQFRWAGIANLALSGAGPCSASVTALRIAPRLATLAASLTRTRGADDRAGWPEMARS